MYTAQQFFCAMYFALDAVSDKAKNEKLQEFLRDANPFLFKDGRSADPAIFAGFEEHFKKLNENSGVDAAGGLDCVRSYLADEFPKLLEGFDSVVDEGSWESALAEIDW